MTKITATLTDKGLSLIVDGEPTTLASTHLNFQKILTCLKLKDYDAIPKLLDVAKAIVDHSKGLVTITNGIVFYAGTAMHNALTDRMLKMVGLGVDIKHMALFLDNLMKNPSYRSVEQLYNFMEACDMPITEDGCLLAYRSVNNDYWDTHTGKTSLSLPPDKVNNVSGVIWDSTGKVCNGVFVERFFVRNGVKTLLTDEGTCVVSMERNLVDDNPDQTCSKGLHVCSQKYGMYGKRLLLVKVNPADVVSVPKDYNQAKMRVCRYEVVKDVQHEGFKTFENTPVYFDEDSYEGEFEDCDVDVWNF